MLVAKMAAASPLWGAPRIHGKLCKLGAPGLRTHRVEATTERPRRNDGPNATLQINERGRDLAAVHAAHFVSDDGYARMQSTAGLPAIP